MSFDYLRRKIDEFDYFRWKIYANRNNKKLIPIILYSDGISYFSMDLD